MENRLKGSQFRHGSSFYSSMSGLTTTMAQDRQEDDVRKSRIEHLPSYRRCDLSNKLQFVVVFQTIQIERLSLEIESLRVMLKDSERQIRNYQNYEVQIKQLTENCHQLEEQRINYQNQVQKMSLACNSLYQQLSDTKRQNQKEIEELKRQFFRVSDQLMRGKEEMGRKVKRLQEELQSKLNSQREAQNKSKAISQELVRLNQMLLQSQNQIGGLRQKDSQKNDEVKKYMQQLRTLKNASEEQKRLRNNQIEKVKNIQCQKEQLNKKCVRFQQTQQKLIQELDDKQRVLNDFQNQNKQLRYGFAEMTEQVQKQKANSNKLGSMIEEMKHNISTKSAEVQKLKAFLRDYEKQMQFKSNNSQQLNEKILNLQGMFNENNKLKDQLNQLGDSLEQKQDQLYNKEQFITELTIQNKQLFHKSKELQSNYQKTCQTIQQIESSLQTERQNSYSQRTKLQSQYQKTLQKISNQKQSLLAQKQQLQKQIRDLKTEGLVNQNMKSEIKRLNQNCKKQQKNIQEMTNRFPGIQSLLKEFKLKQQKVSQLQRINQIMSRQFDESINLNDVLLKKVSNLNLQIDNLSNQIYRMGQKSKPDFKDDDFVSLAESNVSKCQNFSIPPKIPQIKATITSNLQKSINPIVQSGIYMNSTTTTTYQRQNFNTDVNLSKLGKSRSILGDQFEAKKILQPSSYYQSRESNYVSSMGNYTSRDSGYGLQRRDKR